MLEYHISHKNLTPLKDFTLLDHIINCEYSQYWIKLNSFDSSTNLKFSKIVGWRIKNSNYQLLMLDILNRNYPDLLNGFDTCFFVIILKKPIITYGCALTL